MSAHIGNIAVVKHHYRVIEPHCATQIEFPVAIVDKNIDRKRPETRVAAEAFLQYLFTPTAQQEFMDCGFRCVLQSTMRITCFTYYCQSFVLIQKLHACSKI